MGLREELDDSVKIKYVPYDLDKMFFKYTMHSLEEQCKPEYLDSIMKLYNSQNSDNLELIIATENVWKK